MNTLPGMAVPTDVRLRLTVVFLAICAFTAGCASPQTAFTSAPPTVLKSSAAASVVSSMSPFTVTSAASVNGALGIDSTCDGAAKSPALAWANEPSGTNSYAIVMDHVPPEGGHHWYWVEWGIPASTHSVTAGETDNGVFGGNSVNPNVGYAPPCSKGPGLKTYTITVYALSQTPDLPTASTASVNRDTLLSAISGVTLAKASVDLTYSR